LGKTVAIKAAKLGANLILISRTKQELLETKIKVSAFYPGGFDSMLYEKAKRPNPHHQPWMMKTEDIADIVIFMLTRPEDVVIENLIVSKI